MLLTIHSLRDTYRAVSEYLPFHLDDRVRVAEVFGMWQASADPREKEVLDTWIYAYVCRSVSTRLLKGDIAAVSDADALSLETYEQIQKHLHQVDTPALLVNWVSVICRNSWLTYIRHRQQPVPLKARHLPPEETDPLVEQEQSLLFQVVQEAIDTLPSYLVEAARLRILKQLSYEEIEGLTGIQQATLRAYMQRALKRLREVPQLRDWREE